MMRGDADFADGLALAEKGVALAKESGFDGLALALTRALATSYAGDGRFAQARESIDPILADLERTGHRERVTDIVSRHALDAGPRALRRGRVRPGAAELDRGVRPRRAGRQLHDAQRARRPAGARPLPARRLPRGQALGGRLARDRGADLEQERLRRRRGARARVAHPPGRAGRSRDLRRAHRDRPARRRPHAGQHALRRRGPAHRRRPRPSPTG